MKRRLLHILGIDLIIGFLALQFPVSLNAVKAMPGLLSAFQPDGSRVEIRLEGNGSTSRAYTSDGYLLTVDEHGFYVFADCGDDGLPAPTAYRASSPSQRTGEVTGFLKSLNQDKIAEAFSRLDAATPKLHKSPAKAGPGRFDTTFPTKGEQKVLVILVEFADNEFSSTNNPKEYFRRMLNEENFSDNKATGSARDYFVTNSNGQFLPEFDVYGPVKLEKEMAWYGQHVGGTNDRRPEKVITDACTLADDEIDFSQYDCDGDGVIDNVYVFYAGYGEAEGGGADTIWPHSAFLTQISKKKYYFDGLLLDRYACSNELKGSPGYTVGIGTFVHEFSHVLGLPDIYATNYNGAFTPAAWSCIDNGNYNNDGRTPPYYSAYERYVLDWMEPTVLSESELGAKTLDIISDTNEAFIIMTDNENEYFLFENRQQKGYDAYIPGHGMLVWHIDFDENAWATNTANNEISHQRVDLVEADNMLHDYDRSSDTFPGDDNVTSFTWETTPALRCWNGNSLGIGLVEIAESDEGIITFNLVSENQASVDKVSVAKHGKIIVTGFRVSCPDGMASIYDFSGRLITKVGADGISLPKGLYVAKTEGGSLKFSI